MTEIKGCAVFSEKWCKENEKKNAWVSAIAFVVVFIPTPPTQIYGALVSGVMAGITLLFSY